MVKRKRDSTAFVTRKRRRIVRVKRRRFIRRRRMPIARGPFPAERIVKLKYCATGQLSSTSGALASTQIKMNSVYAPEISTKQPYGFDQWALLYNHYVVLGSQMRVYGTAVHGAENNLQPLAVGVMLTDEAAFPYTDYLTAIEHNRSSFKLFQTNLGQKVKLVKNYSAKKFFNVKDVKDNLDRIGGTVAADVSEGAYMHLWQQPIDKTSTVASNYVIVVNYIVSFSEPKDVVAS